MNTQHNKITFKQRLQYLYYRLRYELQSPLCKQYTLSDVLCLIAVFLTAALFIYVCLVLGIPK